MNCIAFTPGLCRRGFCLEFAPGPRNEALRLFALPTAVMPFSVLPPFSCHVEERRRLAEQAQNTEIAMRLGPD
jgi:hypothetical protein